MKGVFRSRHFASNFKQIKSSQMTGPRCRGVISEKLSEAAHTYDCSPCFGMPQTNYYTNCHMPVMYSVRAEKSNGHSKASRESDTHRFSSFRHQPGQGRPGSALKKGSYAQEVAQDLAAFPTFNIGQTSQHVLSQDPIMSRSLLVNPRQARGKGA